ncbi:4Fe-4S single cluster domain-containing protein [Kitasatospora kifunensis]|uniref:Anaerobic ribonucleoside-triphosphate reductase activating protein n=1 Tax=Kitasatospora kifunensis TaxID=58351 RepID=A0A7W7R973_KITKI|nr:4Fe-4S single cluster domain-containing protein [Kitasatospora kifunensis]MBB4927560.1 anaerobic ribonucleoside-triphosphate reductase activating protein [Kitasatospora kifunensis]
MNNQPATERSARLSVARTLDQCSVLGPGSRAVIWVQGCPLRCRGCVAAETLPFAPAEQGRPVAELVDWLAALPGIEGVTLSGGEPFAQADALVELLDQLRQRRPELSAMAYSGFRLTALRRGSPGQRALLERLDLLVDGPYVAALHADLRWRGSTNQRIHLLTQRYAKALAEPDTSAGLQLSVGLDGAVSWAGVPAVPGFRAELERRLATGGFELRQDTPDHSPQAVPPTPKGTR